MKTNEIKQIKQKFIDNIKIYIDYKDKWLAFKILSQCNDLSRLGENSFVRRTLTKHLEQ